MLPTLSALYGVWVPGFCFLCLFLNLFVFDTLGDYNVGVRENNSDSSDTIFNRSARGDQFCREVGSLDPDKNRILAPESIVAPPQWDSDRFAMLTFGNVFWFPEYHGLLWGEDCVPKSRASFVTQPQGPVHTGRRAPRNRCTQIMEHIVVNGSVHTAGKWHQRVCTKFACKCAYASCVNGT